MHQEIVSVPVTVVDARPSGIHVLLLNNDGQKGYIRPREISWERRVSMPAPLPDKGEVLQAAILNEKVEEGLVFLSLRKLTDPWKIAFGERKYKVGQIVEGEVVNVRNSGVYVQLEPGVDALITPKDVPILSGRVIEDVLWLGDKISATITSIDQANRLIHISLIRRFQKLPVNLEDRQFQLLDRFGVDARARKMDDFDTKLSVSNNSSTMHYIKPILSRLRKVLIIDDEEKWLGIISKAIEKEYQASVECVTRGKDGLARYLNEPVYDLIIVDINLNQENGIEIARKIREQSNKTAILIISVAEFNEDGWFAIEDEFPFSHKSTEAILERIDDLRHGYWQESKVSTLIGKESFVDQLGIQAFSNQESQQIFNNILSRLLEQTQVSQCLLLELDRSLQSVKILSSYPPLSDNHLKIAQDGLYFSPARTVIEEEREFVANEIDFENDTRFKNFMLNLDFESCLGLPVPIPNLSTQYGLFLLSEETYGFYKGDLHSEERILYAKTACSILTVTIERQRLFEYMRRYEERYALGQLLGDMVHEVNNKLTAMDGSLGRIGTLQTSRPSLQDSNQVEEWNSKIDSEIKSIARIETGIKELVHSYSRQARNEYDDVDLNQVVGDVARQLARRAKQMDVTIYLDLDKDLPNAVAIQSRLQQIILNLSLNAIQMMSDHQDLMKSIGEKSHNYLPALEKGVLILQTRLQSANPSLPLEVRILDTGPGVHWRDRERIFAPGFSRRGGAGLGLYISRNLAERMGGRLDLFDSILFLGSAFVLELPSRRTEMEE